MKALKWIAGLLVLLCLLFAAFLWYMGFFSSLQVYEQEMGPYTYAYERFVGPYWEVGPVFKKLEAALKADGIKATEGIGIYHDDPAKVAKDKLRSDCGFTLNEAGLQKVQSFGKKYQIATMPKKLSMVVEFPKKNDLSYMLGPIKCYPALMKYAKERKYKLAAPYELYLEDKTLFVMEIVR